MASRGIQTCRFWSLGVSVADSTCWVLAFLLMSLCSCPPAHALLLLPFLLMQTHKVVKELGRHTDLRTAGECFAAVLRLIRVFWRGGAATWGSDECCSAGWASFHASSCSVCAHFAGAPFSLQCWWAATQWRRSLLSWRLSQTSWWPLQVRCWFGGCRPLTDRHFTFTDRALFQHALIVPRALAAEPRWLVCLTNASSTAPFTGHPGAPPARSWGLHPPESLPCPVLHPDAPPLSRLPALQAAWCTTCKRWRA